MTDLLSGLNAAQRQAVTETEGFVRVIAGAGSGKTRALSHRFAFLVNELGILPGNILCVTFTNKSANEMRQRIHILTGDNDTGYINTFHGFCVSVLQEDSLAVQYPKSFLVLDNADIDAMLQIIYEVVGLTRLEMTCSAARVIVEIQKLFKPNTKAVFGETLANPALTVFDIEKWANIAHRNNVPLIVDNTFATPVLCRPIEWGVNVVTHSATKWIGGHGTSLGGVVVDGGNFDWKASGKYAPIAAPNPSYHGVSFADAVGPAAFVTYIRAILLRDEGPCISPFNAWILLQGTETLSLRVDRHAENTKKVVEYLLNNPHVAKVNHPSLPDHPDHELYQKYFPNGGASIFTFEIEGGKEAAWKFIDNLQIFSLLANVADVKSLVIHPASTTHSQLTEAELADQGITPSTIRLSIGTENADDIIWDLEQAFAKLD